MRTVINAYAGNGGITATGTTYGSFFGGRSLPWGTPIGSYACPMSIYGAVSRLYVRLPLAVGAGASYTLSLNKNGTATGLTVTIDNSAIVQSDVTHSVSFAPGDLLCWQAVPSTAPAPVAPADFQLSFVIDATTPGESTFGGSFNSLGNTSTQYASAMTSSYGGTSEYFARMIVPCAGVISNLWGFTDTATGSAIRTYTYTIRQATGYAAMADTALSMTIGTDATNKTGTPDTTHSVTVAAGDMVDISDVPTNTPNAGSGTFSVRFVPTISGESIMPAVTQIGNQTGTFYLPQRGAGRTNSTESSFYGIAPVAFTWKKLQILSDQATGAAQSRTVTSRVNGANGALTTNIAGATQKTNSDLTNTVSVNAGDLFNMSEINTAGATTYIAIYYSSVAYIAPAVASTSIPDLRLMFM